jgi:hypothetical protein
MKDKMDLLIMTQLFSKTQWKGWKVEEKWRAASVARKYTA